MSSYSATSAAPASSEDGWTRVGSKFRGDAATAFSRPPRRVAARAEFSEDARSAFNGRGPRPERPTAVSFAFGEDASAAFGRRPVRGGDGGRRPRAEFDEAAASAFGGGGARRTGFDDDASRVFGGGKKPRGDDASSYSRGSVSRYVGSAAPPPPVKKQTFDEAFPMLGGGGAPAPIIPETADRLPTLAEKLRKKVAEEAAEDERRAKAAEEAAARRAAEARERAIFATLGASRVATSTRYTTSGEYEDDTAPANYEDDLDCGAFGESTVPRGGAYVASKYDQDYEGYGEDEDDY